MVGYGRVGTRHLRRRHDVGGICCSQLAPDFQLAKEKRVQRAAAYLQMSMYRTRLVCYMDSGLLVSRSMVARVRVVRLALVHFGGIEADRG